MKVIELKVNHIENPLGYLFEKITLSWKVIEALGKGTSFTQVKISLDEQMKQIVFDSNKIEGVLSLGYVPAMEWEENQKYFWTVTVWSDEEECATSEVAYFQTPKKHLQGCLIEAPFIDHPFFIKLFEIKENIKNASLFISGLGLYEIALNGEKVGNEYLTPYYNDYNHWVQYQTYDITKQLKEGNNAIEVILGNGWYKGRFGFLGDSKCLYGDSFAFICELEIILESGKVITISSDESWKCRKSSVLESGIYDGEVYDSRLETSYLYDENLDMAEIEEMFPCQAILVENQKAKEITDKLSPRKSLPVTVQEERKPLELITTNAGELVLDFGQIMTGFVVFECEEKEGTKITLQHGEILQYGNFSNQNLRTAKQEFTYISNGKSAFVRPHFTYYGFRYVKVEGMAEVNPENFTAWVLHSDMETTGNILTSNEKVNRLFLNALWGQKGNFLDVPTDCPQRDERMGWTGDAQAFSGTANFNMYTPAFFDKYLYDMRLEQRRLNGSVPFVVPDTVKQIVDGDKANKKNYGVFHEAHGGCAWGDAATIIPWNLYCYYGDIEMLKQQYENMKMWVNYIKSVDDEKCDGKRLWTHGFHFGDWLALDNFHADSNFGGTDNYFVASAFYLYSTELLVKAAKVLKKENDVVAYTKLAEEIRLAMQTEYFTETGRIAVDTQTAMVLALYFNIVKKEHKGRIVQDLKRKLDEENCHMNTGFVGTSYLCLTLSENGLSDYAYQLLLNEDYPSWLYAVNLGATTIWERWNSVMEDGNLNSAGMNSLNHYAYGAIVEWMYRYMGGIHPMEEKPGFREFIIAPHIDARFEWVNVTYNSPFGMIESGWKIEDKKVVYEITVPFDTKAKFILNECTSKDLKVLMNGLEIHESMERKELVLESGKYVIEVVQV